MKLTRSVTSFNPLRRQSPGLSPCWVPRFSAAIEQEPIPAFDVAPFVLPNSPPGEIRFEETARHRGR